MGNWAITIVGCGAHHNSEKHGGKYPQEEAEKFDANEQTKAFVEQLKAAGHSIRHVSFVSGSDDGDMRGLNNV